MGGFVGSHAMCDRWVEPMVADWVKGVEALAGVARSIPNQPMWVSHSLCRLNVNIFAAVSQMLASTLVLWRWISGAR